jgi:two-component system, LuxR family, sensor kinase FixL
MNIHDLASWYAPERRTRSLIWAAALIVLIASVDAFLGPNIGLGTLYLFPLLAAAGFLSHRQIVALALGCAFLRELFGPAHNALQIVALQSVARIGFVWLSFASVGLFMRELVFNREQALEHLGQLRAENELRELEVRRREDAERQLQALIESSPAAILTTTESGIIELSNDAARKLLRTTSPLAGQNINRFLPDIGVIQSSLGDTSALRTAFECRGTREDGHFFLGQLWMSRFTTHAGSRLAVIISDASEQLRDREEVGLEQSLSNSRLLVAAVSHEIRNLSGAVAIAHTNLARVPELEKNSDFASLGKLIEGLRNLASAELMPAIRAAQEGLELKTVFDDLRIVLQTSAEEAGVQICWQVQDDLPRVLADRQGLFQVFLNLTHNSFRAMQDSEPRVLTISGDAQNDMVAISFRDTGTGVTHPERLFKMFRSGTNSSGIGLYISRAILRSYGGDLRYEPTDSGACFSIELLGSKGMS